MILDFFGLTPEYKADLHKLLFQFVTFGKGGWSWEVVYNLPIGLRNMYWRMLVEAAEKENKAAKKSTPKKGVQPG